MSEIHRRRPRLSFHLSGMIADHRRFLRRVGKIETLPILQIWPRPSQTIGDIYNFEFSLVGKIWDSRETVKSLIVWYFPDIRKPGLVLRKKSKRRSSALNKVDESFLWLKNYWAYSLGREFLLSLSLFCFYITTSDILLQINNSIKMR